MKKVLVLACMSLGAMSSVLTSHAQSIPNGGFDNWESAGTSLHTMSDSRITQRPGEEPASWNGSSITLNGLANAKKEKKRVNKIVEGENTYVRLDNAKVGCTDGILPWNGRLSLGETWASFFYEKPVFVIYDVPTLDGAKAANKYAQAGSYDGMEFTYRPDAIRARVSRNNAGENYHIVAYIWNGSDFGDVPANLSYNNNEGYVKSWYSLENSDRVLMGKIAKTSGDAHVLASVDYTDNTAHDWKDLIIPLNYNSAYPADERPAKTNVIFCAGDPWDIQTAVDGNTLSVDDVNYVYYSRLDGVSFSGHDVEGFDSDIYEYNLDFGYPNGYDEIAYTVKGQSLDKTVTIDPLWQQLRIDLTVTYTGGNGEGYDVDGESSHTYSFYFAEKTSGVDSLPESMARVTATVGSVSISAFTGVAEVFTVDGRLVARSEIDGNGEIALAKGIYLVRTGSKTARVYVR
ncbi:MAG: hypothetical protein ACI309_02740 [Candidatus Limisoma sp.]